MTVRKHSPIAVVGVSTLFPGSVDTTGFWRNIVEGNDLMSAVPPGHWLTEDYYDPDPKAPDKTYANRGAFLPEVDFDPMAWGIPPNIVPATDTCQLLALIVAQRVLDDAAKGQFKYEDRERMSVMLGVTSAQELLGAMVSRLQRPVWTQSLRDMGMPESQVQEACTRIESHYTPWQESTFPGILGNVVAGRIANRLDLGGKNCVTDAACASSLAALSMSITELQMGDSDVCICGGADTMNDIFMYMCFSKTPALSQTGDCRPFSDDADGTMLGEGFGMLALKRLEDAERDGDRVYGVIRGLGGSSDGRAKSVYAPVPAGQAKAVRRAYAQAEFGAETVELVEAHGTGTIAGDAAEFEGMKTVFREADANTKQWCAVGSVKSQIGHTKAAAGAAGMVKAVLALHHKVFPPSIKIHAPNPKLDLEQSPFYLSARTRPWIRNSDHPRRAAVSAFGFGGSNFHVALEEYTGPADKAYRRRTAPTELVLLSADSHDALASRCRELSAQVSEPGTLVYLARTTQESYDPKANARLALVAKDEAELAQKLDKAAGLVMKGEAFETPDGLAFGLGAIEGDVAFLFPGQGSQFIDMGADLAMNWDDARAPWDAAADLDIFRAEPLHDVVFPKPAFEEEALAAQGAKLTATEWAQPGIGVTSLASLRLMRAIGLEPSAVAGHSFGEVIALHAAGVLSEEDAMRVARRRGELMAEAASTPGSMTAVSASAEVVRGLLAKSATGVVLANDNSPAQVVVSGKTDAIAAFEKELDAEGVRFTRLGVATAFHSEVVSASTIPFGEFLASVNVSSPELPVYANSEAAPYPSDAGAIRALLGNQIARPVRFVEEIEAMYAAGVRTFVEVGPGSVLTGLVGRILKGRPHRAISTDRKGRHGVTSLNHALGKLAAAGAEMNVGALWQAFEPASDPRDVSKPRMVMKLSGSNYGKPYPPENGAAGRTKPNPERLEAPAVERIQERALTDTVHTPAARIAEPALVQPIAVQPVAVQAVAVQPVAQPVAQPIAVQAVAVQAVAVQPVAQPVAQPIAVQAVAVQAAMPASAPVSDAWATAYQEAQRQTAEAHSTYTRSMAEAHGAFLELQKASFLGLAQMMNTSVTVQAAPMQPAPMQPAPMQVAPMQPAHAPTWSAPVAAPAPVVAAPGPMPAPVAAPVAAPVVVAPVVVAPVAASAAVATAPVAAPTTDLRQLMLEVVADKTGYPVDMLQLSMDLEADLGVDSIKRVEILSAMREREPNLPDVDPTELSKLRTLQEIVDAMDTRMPAASAAVAAAAVAAAPAIAAATTDLRQLMLEVVADKTGYPVDMLQLSMDLEADLGVDSIKRVEILSAMREREPNLPDVDPTELSKLRTLQEIVDAMDARDPAAAPVAASAAVAAAPVAPPTTDLRQLMLEVVADKTGYPVDMLQLSMDLEADLGVDSIKRVEILSAMREREPNLPDVDPTELSKLRTLQEIVDAMDTREQPASALVAAATTPEPAASHATTPAAARYALRLVNAPASGFALPRLASAKRLVITDDGAGVASALVDALARRGVSAQAVSEIPNDADGVIFLGGLADLPDVNAALAVNRQAFLAAKTIADKAQGEGAVFVTVQDTGGDFGLTGSARAWLGGLPGLVKTAAQEWPHAGLRAIDLERGGRDGATLAEVLAEELLRGGPTRVVGASGGGLEVALAADGSRRTLQSYAAEVQKSTPVVTKDSVLLCSGGARGVTAATLIALAGDTGCSLILLGRTPLEDEDEALRGAQTDAALKKALLALAQAAGEKLTPAELGKRASRVLAGREVRATLNAIDMVGGRATYVAASVTDASALRAALAPIRAEFGKITGIVHGAGVLADRRIADKTVDQFDWVFSTKVDGLRTLLEVTAEDDISLLLTFSSVAARCGNRGQCDYAMANEVLNKVVTAESARRGGALFARSMGWGPWAGGMVTPALKARFEAMGVPLIALPVGARMLVDELSDGSGNVELVLGGEPKPEALLEDGTSAGERFEVHVSQATYPVIDHHRVQGTPVVPVALVLEWFARGVGAARPDLVLHTIEHLKVLSGIKLEHFEGGGEDFTVVVRRLSNGDGATFGLELLDSAGRRRYSARARAERVAHAASTRPTAPANLAALKGPVYDGVALFHGPQFQVIRGLPDVGDAGLMANLVGASEVGWPQASWQTDPALVDGGLQLALLWTAHTLGGASLPTALGKLEVFQRGLPVGELRATLTGHEARGEKTVCDVSFVDAAGTKVAKLGGVEMHVIPGSRSTSGTPTN